MESPFGNHGDAETFLARAELLFDLDRFDEAREELGGALSADPAHVPSLTLLAILELQVGKHDDALTAASAALAAEPTHDTARLARGHALALLRRTEEALDAATEIQDLYPESWWHNVHYALIVRESRNGQDALDAAWVAVRLAPEDARAHIALARVAVDLGLTDLAERALATAERLDPGVSSILEGELGPQLLRGSPNSSRRTHTGAKDEWAAASTTKRQRPKLPEPARNVLRIAGMIGIVIPLLAGCISGGQQSTARIVAGLGAVAGAFALVMVFQRLPESLRDELRVMIDTDKLLGLAVALAACGPLLAGVYAATGTTFLLAIAMLAGFGALMVAFMHGRLPATGRCTSPGTCPPSPGVCRPRSRRRPGGPR
ncbi:tetratricopeptide repeat protein [Stackebrandtia nassauensis]|uniref:tetratricopeptide repeat protein n=1 Tax=Stackebrandtia nassauensis TaxID=283811 RepID=UPI0001A3930C|nr:tetratricopeptide repeat protein [Stackebrandtia nassauensis]